MSGSSCQLILFGLGFNGYGQLNIEHDRKSLQESLRMSETQSDSSTLHHSLLNIHHPPKKLISFPSNSGPQLTFTSCWDSIHLYEKHKLKDGSYTARSFTTGRWKDYVDVASKHLKEEKIIQVAETRSIWMARTKSRMLVLSNCPGDKHLDEVDIISNRDNSVSVSVKGIVDISSLADDSIYILTDSGLVYECKFGEECEGEIKTISRLALGAQMCPEVPISHLSCGSDHVMFLVAQTGMVLSHGLNTRGQLGHGDIVPRTAAPEVVEALHGIEIAAIECGNWHTLALSVYGDIYSWGWNEHRQLGHSFDTATIATPTLIEVDISGLSHKQLKLTVEEGSNDRGEMKDVESRVDFSKGVESEMSGDAVGCEVNFSSISCGARHSAAISENGELFTWGWNSYGQLGRHRVTTKGQDSGGWSGALVDGKCSVIPAAVDHDQLRTVAMVHCCGWNTLFLGVNS